MERRTFLELAAAVPLLGTATQSAAAIALPVELRGGRFFAVPKLSSGADFACWLDTDGRGFVFEEVVRRLALPTRADGARAYARLPVFSPQRAVPPLVRDDGELPVFAKGPADASDPILAGFDAQLGASWFADRTWNLDFGRGSMEMRLTPLGAGDANVPLEFDRIYPRITARVAGDALPMSLDIAASVAVADSAGTSARVEATSFIARSVFERWHVEHPDWRVERNVSVQRGIDRILVPEIVAGGVTFAGVAFTTRPGDDVFEGDTVTGKLGANAYARRSVTIDYPNVRLAIR